MPSQWALFSSQDLRQMQAQVLQVVASPDGGRSGVKANFKKSQSWSFVEGKHKKTCVSDYMNEYVYIHIYTCYIYIHVYMYYAKINMTFLHFRQFASQESAKKEAWNLWGSTRFFRFFQRRVILMIKHPMMQLILVSVYVYLVGAFKYF